MYLDTRQEQVRDRLARFYPEPRWIYHAEVNWCMVGWNCGASAAAVAAALWWCAAHREAAQLSLLGAFCPWEDFDPLKARTDLVRRNIRHNRSSVHCFGVETTAVDLVKQSTDNYLLTEQRSALIDSNLTGPDRIRLPMPWGVVDLDLEGQ